MCAALTALWAFAAAPSAGAQDDEGPNANLFQLWNPGRAPARAGGGAHRVGAWAGVAELQALIEDHAGGSR